MKLVIVESPTKAKTIQKFLPKTYKVVSSYGHVRDLPKSKMGIDLDTFVPQYVIPTKVRKKVNELKKLAKEADSVVLATDEDREGEAIAWHLVEALDLKDKPTERIAFHEITKDAIVEALEKPRSILQDLVDAQQARRILDRLVGYELSPLLWRKLYKGLSAGRVQSVAVRLVVEREREIEAFKPEEYWSINGNFAVEGNELETKLHAKDGKKLDKFAITSDTDANKLVADLKNSSYKVAEIKGRETKKKAPTPFTTSLLQQEASSRLSMSPKQTMQLAQQLYEGVKLGKGGAVGLITYMRTDSMNLSGKFLSEAQDHLKNTFGKEYALDKPRVFKSKSKNAQEAHEAIRPTDVSNTPESVKDFLDARQYKLYDLIWRRAVASQMPEAVARTTTIDINGDTKEGTYTFRAAGSILQFDGWRKLYPERSEENILPEVNEGADAELKACTPNQHFTEPPARYSDATLIKALEEYGIGRPSTYAPTISTILDRSYVERDDRRLVPTDLAKMINDLLVEHFPNIVDLEFTANLEEELDEIAEGDKQMQPVLSQFYKPFKELITKADEAIDRKDLGEEETDEKCDKCGKPMIIKMGRFGKFMACTGFPDCKNAKPLPGSEEEMTTDEKCPECGKDMQVKRGRFGPFLGCVDYPECKGIKAITIGIDCPECKQGELTEKRSRFGKSFFGCERYPDCKFAVWSKPTGEKCPDCGALIVYGAKGTLRCSAKGCKYKTEAPTTTE